MDQIRLVLTKLINGKHKLKGLEKEKIVAEDDKKQEVWKVGHYKVITRQLWCADNTIRGQIFEILHMTVGNLKKNSYHTRCCLYA